MKSWLRNVIVTFAALLLLAGTAAAEEVRTKRSVTLRAAPNPLARRVSDVPSDRNVKVLSRQGRWLRVDHGGKVGWVAEENVEAKSAPAPKQERAARAERKESSGRDRSKTVKTRGRRPAGNDTSAAKTTPAPAGKADSDQSGADQVSANNAKAAAKLEGEPGNQAAKPGKGDKKGAKRPSKSASVGKTFVVVADTVQAFEGADASSSAIDTLKRGNEVIVVAEQEGSWFLVELPSGKNGWIASNAVRSRESLTGSPEPAREPRPVRVAAAQDKVSVTQGDARQPSGPGFLEVLHGYAHVGVGVAAIGHNLEGDAAGSGYDASSAAAALRIGMDALYPLSDRWHAGLSGTYFVFNGSTSVTQGGMEVSGIGYIDHGFTVAAKAGYTSSFGVFARAGLYVETFYVRDLLNDVNLPRERLITPMVGVEVWLPKFVAPLAIALGGDAMIPGSRAQTRGIEDGASVDSAIGGSAYLHATYRLTSRLSLDARYQFLFSATSWTGASARDPGVTNASRSDQLHALTLGAATTF